MYVVLCLIFPSFESIYFVSIIAGPPANYFYYVVLLLHYRTRNYVGYSIHDLCIYSLED